tara:strand:+ start:445 stop:669 length:225 start_codon:yes stop_codon:yes gene_type:complete
MEEIYTIDTLTLREVRALRQGLNTIDIKGVDALFLATLQLKLNEQIKQIDAHIEKEKNTKNQVNTPPSKKLNKK